MDWSYQNTLLSSYCMSFKILSLPHCSTQLTGSHPETFPFSLWCSSPVTWAERHGACQCRSCLYTCPFLPHTAHWRYWLFSLGWTWLHMVFIIYHFNACGHWGQSSEHTLLGRGLQDSVLWVSLALQRVCEGMPALSQCRSPFWMKYQADVPWSSIVYQPLLCAIIILHIEL